MKYAKQKIFRPKPYSKAELVYLKKLSDSRPRTIFREIASKVQNYHNNAHYNEQG